MLKTMTPENKELLLQDLCARLPYDLQVKIVEDDEPYTLLSAHPNKDIALIGIDMGGVYATSKVKIDTIKPYLRPMSSMTKEEREEMYNLLSPEGTAIYGNDGIALPLNHCGEFVPYEFMNRIIQYLLEHHFDFMGLIPKDLAIEVTESNNPYKE